MRINKNILEKLEIMTMMNNNYNMKMINLKKMIIILNSKINKMKGEANIKVKIKH